MKSMVGRSVRLFLVDGTPSGLTTAEIMNWTGHVLSGSRGGLPAFLRRHELDRTGVYFLTGADPEDPDLTRLYIGESDNVRTRLIQHSKDASKDFWERTCVVTSKDTNITKAHARYLEARLIEIAKEAGTAILANGTAPPRIALPEADVSDMEYFIEQVRLVLPVLGLDFLQRAKPDRHVPSFLADDDRNAGDIPVFALRNKRRDIEARAQVIDGEFVVLAGSDAAEWSSPQKDSSYERRQARLIKQGKLVEGKSGLMRFAEDVIFKSPSAASAVILGRPDNGRKSWRIPASGMTYDEWESQQVEGAEAMPAGGCPEVGNDI